MPEGVEVQFLMVSDRKILPFSSSHRKVLPVSPSGQQVLSLSYSDKS